MSIFFVITLSLFLMFDRIDLLQHFGVVVGYDVYLLGVSIVIFQILLSRVYSPPLYLIIALVVFVYLSRQLLLGDIFLLNTENQNIAVLIEFSLLMSISFAAWLYVTVVCNFGNSLRGYMADMTFSLKSVSQARKKIEIEIDRSRRYHRPLSIIVINPKDAFSEKIVNSAGLEFHSKCLAREFFLNKLGKFFLHSKRSHDLVLQFNNTDKLVLLCPETTAQEATAFMDNMRREVKKRLGVEIQTGVAAFPEDSTTFDELLVKAEGSSQDQITPQLTATLIKYQKN